MNNKIISKIGGLALAILCGSSAHALTVAPYFESWSSQSLMDAKANAGLNSAVLAFGITNGSCAFDSGFLQKATDARNYKSSGGSLTLSLGGQNGVYVEVACKDDNQLFNILDKLIVDFGTKRLDFDVEGSQLQDSAATARRSRVLARLQAKYPDLYISFTLPAWFRGVDDNGINLLKNTVAAGVRVDMVNVMVMSFGKTNVETMISPATLSQAAIVSFKASALQMAPIWPSKSQSQIHSMMGMTPMIGTNDDATVFTLNDAKLLTDFAKSNGVAQISYWSFQRDKAQSYAGMSPVNAYIGVVQSAYQYYKTFNSSSVPEAPVVVPTPEPTGYQNWAQGTNYTVGNIISYNGVLYKAKVANPGYNPSISTYYWERYTAGAAPAPVETSPVTTSPAWVDGKSYAAGSIVSYNGRQYKAKFANPGYNPTISTYYWEIYTSAPVASPTISCTSTVWVDGKSYAAGSIVSYNGALYKAKFANPGYNPTISTYYWESYTCTTTTPVTSVPPVTTTPQEMCNGFEVWLNTRWYTVGKLVYYSGKSYVATIPNQNSAPNITPTHWSLYKCP